MAPNATSASSVTPVPEDGHARTLTIRFWLRPVEITGDERVTGLVLERTRLDENGAFQGTGELETLEAQMVLRSVGYQSVPLDGVPFDERAAVVPNAAGRVLGPDGIPLPGEYVSGWLKRGPTGVIGTNKSDAAETVRSLLADLAGEGAIEETALPRPGMLRYPDGAPATAGARVQALEEALARRGIRPVSYAEWLRVENGRGGTGALAGPRRPGQAARQGGPVRRLLALGGSRS